MKKPNALRKLLSAANVALVLMLCGCAGSPIGPEARMRERNITLPAAPPPVANYLDAVRVGHLYYFSGSTSRDWVFGMVNAADGLTDTAKVINGFSDLMVEVFGESGKHARSAIGVAALPGNAPVEVEVVLEVNE